MDWTQSAVPDQVDVVVPSGPAGGRRKGTACVRCRTQKIRCDDEQPSCSNCARSGQECIRSRSGKPEVDSYVQQLESRVKWLEKRLEECVPRQYMSSDTIPPDVSGDKRGRHDGSTSHPPLNAGISPASAAISSPTNSQIGPEEPLAHNVGLLSLTNSKESKYLGPSSGVTFGKLVFSAMPASQGLPATLASSNLAGTRRQSLSQRIATGPIPKIDMHYFAACYLETYQPFYPFLTEDEFLEKLEVVDRAKIPLEGEIPSGASMTTVELAQICLVLAIGAKTLESRLSTDFSSELYHAVAMKHIERINVLESIPGVQILLLLTLSSFLFEDGLNAWYLCSTIIASCIDLGLQRKHSVDVSNSSDASTATSSSTATLRSGIFWSAYSLDRTLTVILGRPLTLRDEAIDVPFPGQSELTWWSDYEGSPTNSSSRRESHVSKAFPSKRLQLSADPFKATSYSLRYDQITAEIKLTLYRVAQSPHRFPWPKNLPGWQLQVQKSCQTLLECLRHDLRWTSSRSTDRTLHELELKYHSCIMLLYRQSPAIPNPSALAVKACYHSAVQTIQIYSKLHRFANMPRTWLAAHTIFVSGITMLYCTWTTPEIKASTSLEEFLSNAATCTKLLEFLGRTWSVAEDAKGKFERLALITSTSWRTAEQDGQNCGDKSLDDLRSPDLTNDFSASADDFQFTAEAWSGADDNVSGLFTGELGDMSSWFDLGWLTDVNPGT